MHLSTELDRSIPTSLSWLQLLVLCAIVAACVTQYSTTKILKYLKKGEAATAPACTMQPTSRRASKLDTFRLPDDDGCTTSLLDQYALALSPISTIAPQFATDNIVLAPARDPKEVLVNTRREPRPTVNLALSIILTINIPPSIPGQADDNAINELSDLLEKW